MNILAINTAFAEAQIALETQETAAFSTTPASAKSSENTLPAIDKLLGESGVQLHDITHFAVVVGPGSFTGVRIGVALVKGFLSVKQNAKAVAVNSLELMAYTYAQQNHPETDFYCIQNALSGRFFVAKFNKLGQRISKDRLTQSVPAGLKIGLLCENLSEADAKISLSPENLLEMSKLLVRAGLVVDKNALAPVYIRLSQAEEALFSREIEVCALEEEHLAEVLAISEARFGAHGWQAEAFREELGKAGHFAYVAKAGGEVVAFVFFMETYGDAGKDFNILNIATREGDEGKGFGARLIEAVKAHAKRENGARLWLEVRISNTRAIEFYEFLGFTTDYIRKNYYSNGEDARIMSMLL